MSLSTELTLSEVVRFLPPNHRAYKEYAELVGKAKILEDLEYSLRLKAGHKMYESKIPAELSLIQEISELRSQLAAYEGKFERRLGNE
jgi:hypothetical protein